MNASRLDENRGTGRALESPASVTLDPTCGTPSTDPATGDWLRTFSIITTEPKDLTAEVHHRTPIILHERDYDRWLNWANRAPPIICYDPTKPIPRWRGLQSMVDNPRNNGPEMLNSA